MSLREILLEAGVLYYRAVADLDHGNHSYQDLPIVVANPVKSKTNQDRSLDMYVRNSPRHGYGVRSW